MPIDVYHETFRVCDSFTGRCIQRHRDFLARKPSSVSGANSQISDHERHSPLVSVGHTAIRHAQTAHADPLWDQKFVKENPQ
jgi:hypothetical protein